MLFLFFTFTADAEGVERCRTSARTVEYCPTTFTGTAWTVLLLYHAYGEQRGASFSLRKLFVGDGGE